LSCFSIAAIFVSSTGFLLLSLAVLKEIAHRSLLKTFGQAKRMTASAQESFRTRLKAAGRGIVISSLLFACNPPNSPPSMSAQKFVHDPPGAASVDDEALNGTLGVSTGALLAVRESREQDKYAADLYLFPVEGYLSLWIDEIYDLAFSVNSGWQLTSEGNIRLLKSEHMRLGFVHGISFGLSVDFEEKKPETWDGAFSYGFSGGLVGQINTSPRGVLLASVKYTFSSRENWGDDWTGPEDHTHYITTSLGHAFNLSRLSVTPEIILGYGDWNDYAGDEPLIHRDLWIIVASATFSAGY
jgi:hypothetical protein